jgi:hypothetical protein
VDADRQVQGLPTHDAGLLGLALGGVGGREQGQVEGAAPDVAAVHVEGPSGVTGRVSGLAEVAEALGHPRGEVCLVEVRQPGRVVLAGRAVEGPLRLGECGSAGVCVVAGRVAAWP